MTIAHLRVARPTDDPAAVVRFYRDGLGFEVLSQFADHDGFDGVMLGHKDAAYHLEFTRKAGHPAGRAPTPDNLLVFYMPNAADWQTAVERMERAGYPPVKAFNPYWDERGKTFEDPNGYRVVLQNAAWKQVTDTIVRPEAPADVTSIHAVHFAAFPTDEEAHLVDALRAAGRLVISLVAEVDGRVVGHVAFSPVTVDGTAGGLGLAPVAVVPDYQRRGIGGRLIRFGLTAAAATGAGFVVVLGHADYYPRFGFRQASQVGLGNEYGADDAFMVAELRPGGMPPGGGLVRYSREFSPWGPAGHPDAPSP